MAAEGTLLISHSGSVKAGDTIAVGLIYGTMQTVSSNNIAVATVAIIDNEAVIRGISKGTATISIQASGYSPSEYTVTVEAAPSIPIEDLKKNGEKFYPTTVSTAVYRPDGTAVEEALGSQPTKVSQLENDANYVYAADAGTATDTVPDVGTSRLQDGSVTTSKIDGSTLKGFTNMPIATRNDISFGWDWKTDAQRCGNIVFFGYRECYGEHVFSGWVDIDEKMPVGFRPTKTVHLSATNSSNDGSMMLRINPDGSMLVYGAGTTGSRYFPLQGSYPTLDEWPE